jgi:3-oxoacyl-[acyl-carrier-protein] synthase II
MAASSRRTVITGFGLLTPIGCDADSFWRSLLEGKSGVGPIRSFDASSVPTRIAAEVSPFDAKKYVLGREPRKSLNKMARPIQMAVSCANLALENGKVDESKLDPARFGVEFGAGLIATELPDLADASRASANCQPGFADLEKWGAEGIPAIQPLWMLKYLPNMPACHVSIMHNAQGPNNSITESDAASLLALGEAFRILGRDGADFFLVGGCESKINPVSLVRQCLFEQTSKRNDEPHKACRPFDAGRDGLVLGEGSGVLVVEDYEHAKRRGAVVLAEVVGYGAAFDRKLDGSGLARAIRSALKEAGIGPDDLDHVNAHGVATRKADVWEARGLAMALDGGSRRVPVFAAKGYLGNMGAASGATELIASLLGFRHGLMPPSLNHDVTDPECPIDVISGSPRPVTKPYVLKVAFTQMGQCGAVVIRRIAD